MVRPTAEIERFEEIATEVFEPLQRYLLRRANREDADDALSEVMMTIWRRIHVVPEAHVLPWSYGVARRVLANQRRGRARGLRLMEKLGAEPVRHHVDTLAGDGDPELQSGLDALDQRDQEILRLWAWEHLEPREIATVLGLTVNAASLRLSRARRKLAEELARQDSASTGHKQGEGTKEHHDG